MKANSRNRRESNHTIRKELGSHVNRAFLARMPVFKAEPEIPGTLALLLNELDRAEAEARGNGSSQRSV